MKILFILKRYLIEPLGIGCLISQLKLKDFEVDLIQITDNTDVYDYVINYKPDIICFNVWTGGHKYFYDLNKYLKRKYKYISIFGGAHATFCVDSVLSQKDIDYVIKGEGDYALADLCCVIRDGMASTSSVPSLIDVKQPPQDLNKLPLPDRMLLYKYEHNINNPIRSISASRGCPFSCTFCYNEKFNEMFEGKKVRFRNVESVIEEARLIVKEYDKTELFFFQDDEICARLKTIEILAKDWQKKVGKPFHAQLRIESISDDKVKLLKEAGCNSVTFAIESATYETRKNVLNKKFTNEQIDNAIKVIRKYKLRFRIENMLGIPFCNTLQDMWDTYKLNLHYKPFLAWASLCQPYPSTSLGDKCEKAGLYSGNVDDIPDAFFGKTILAFPKKSKTVLENAQKIFSLLIGCHIPIWLAKFIVRYNNKLLGKIAEFYKRNQFKRMYGL